jgi:hypothetical protein
MGNDTLEFCTRNTNLRASNCRVIGQPRFHCRFRFRRLIAVPYIKKQLLFFLENWRPLVNKLKEIT